MSYSDSSQHKVEISVSELTGTMVAKLKLSTAEVKAARRREQLSTFDDKDARADRQLLMVTYSLVLVS